MKCLFPAGVFLLIAFLGPASQGDDRNPREIKGFGTVVDPAGDCEVTEKDGKVTITVPGTHHDLNPTPRFDNVLAPRILQEVEGDFTLQVKVDVFTRPQAKTASSKAGITFVAAGLLVWQDEKNFVRLLRAANGDRGNLFGHLEVYRDGKLMGDGYGSMTDDKVTFLKLSRKGNTFSFAMSADGNDWRDIKGRTADLGNLDLPTKLKVGIAATNATTNKFSPRFEDLSLTAK